MMAMKSRVSEGPPEAEVGGGIIKQQSFNKHKEVEEGEEINGRGKRRRGEGKSTALTRMKLEVRDVCYKMDN